ncbi:MAG: DUF2442 domain-containing protein [Prevotellaceae bacterium]|nr:DUF2442 domain-containing protein [Candidatus Colivivens equi]
MFLEVIKAEYIDGYRLQLFFNNGEVRVADLRPSLKGEVFEPLHDIEMFKRFTINFNTVVWENEVDFAPEYLYEMSKPITYSFEEIEKTGQVADDSCFDYKV